MVNHEHLTGLAASDGAPISHFDMRQLRAQGYYYGPVQCLAHKIRTGLFLVSLQDHIFKPDMLILSDQSGEWSWGKAGLESEEAGLGLCPNRMKPIGWG